MNLLFINKMSNWTEEYSQVSEPKAEKLREEGLRYRELVQQAMQEEEEEEVYLLSKK